MRLDLEARQYINKVLIVILTYKNDKDDENEGSFHGCLQTQFKLRSVIVQVFAFIARQTRTFARLSLLKYVQHVFIFNFKPLSDRIDINIHKYM